MTFEKVIWVDWDFLGDRWFPEIISSSSKII